MINVIKAKQERNKRGVLPKMGSKAIQEKKEKKEERKIRKPQTNIITLFLIFGSLQFDIHPINTNCGKNAT